MARKEWVCYELLPTAPIRNTGHGSGWGPGLGCRDPRPTFLSPSLVLSLASPSFLPWPPVPYFPLQGKRSNCLSVRFYFCTFRFLQKVLGSTRPAGPLGRMWGLQISSSGAARGRHGVRKGRPEGSECLRGESLEAGDRRAGPASLSYQLVSSVTCICHTRCHLGSGDTVVIKHAYCDWCKVDTTRSPHIRGEKTPSVSCPDVHS